MEKDKKKYWYVAQANHLTVDLLASLNRLPFECFAPMQEKKAKLNGREVKRSVPLALNYVFFHTDDFKLLRSILRDVSRVHIIYKAPFRDAKKDSGEDRFQPLIASDKEMEMFMKAASFYSQGAPLTTPDRKLMMKGDRVRIIKGPFEGVEGTLVSQQGKDGGKVIVSIGNLIAVSTIDIAPENIQVIKFAHGNKHIYKKMESFKPRVEKALLKTQNGEPLTDEEQKQIEVFIRRFSGVETETVNTEAKLTLYIFLGYIALRMKKEQKVYFLKLRDEILPKVKSEKNRQAIQRRLDMYLSLNV